MKRFLLLTLAPLVLAVSCTTPATPPATVDFQKLGGQITVDEKAPGKPVTALNLSNVAITDADLAGLEAFPHLQTLDLGHTKKLGKSTITDAGLVHLEKLADLRRLSLTSTEVTDNGLVHLQGLARLESLNLEQTKVTDGGLKHLKGLPKLERLKLQGTAVTKSGVKQLQESLPDCKITY